MSTRIADGTGVDVAPIARVSRLVRDHGARLGRIFTEAERAFCDEGPARRRDARYAAVFAAKEAVMKALGMGWYDVEWFEIDTRPADRAGAVALAGSVRQAADARGVARVRVSTSLTRTVAIASAFAEQVSHA